jgi:erythromycin esterase
MAPATNPPSRLDSDLTRAMFTWMNRHFAALAMLASCGASFAEPPMQPTIDEWIARDAVPFTDEGIDRMIATMPDVQVLGFGEALHGGEEILQLRNRLFQRLVERHGFRAIAIESSFPQSTFVNDHVGGGGEAPNVADWISNGMGLLEANRQLIAWMRQHNADAREPVHFYGFDMPLGTMAFASPRLVLERIYDVVPERRERIESLIGADSDWENPAVIGDPSKGVGGTPRANDLRIEVEEVIAELRRRGPEFDSARHAQALHTAEVARQLLAAHAAMARKAGYAEVLGIRDTIMADNLEFIVAQEALRGRVLVFAHNGHLQRGRMHWRMGDVVHEWWPAGAHLSRSLGRHYAVIGSGVGVSDENGIAAPEAGSLEARFKETALVPTTTAPATVVASLTPRTGSLRNPTYFPWARDCLADFDWLAFVKSTTYQRGGPPLQAWDAAPPAGADDR